MTQTSETVRTTCPYCGVGCGVLAGADGAVTGDPDHPANLGRLCSKGAALGETLGLEGRLLHPQIDGARADWDTALDLVAAKFQAAIAEHGPDSVAFYGSGQLLTEDFYYSHSPTTRFICFAIHQQPSTINLMNFEDFWYIVALSHQLKPNTVLSRTVLDEWLVVFRGEDGKPVALQDKCIHRNSRLSKGKICQGKIQCPYHGWVYDNTGKVVSVPSEGENLSQSQVRKGLVYQTKEQDGYVYVRLSSNPSEEFAPFTMPFYQQPGWETVRVINRFENNVTNCVENFIDIPHTASVHPGVFRKPSQQHLEMTVERRNGCVKAEYRNETTNLGWFTKFLNNKGYKIRHIDSFHMPNITSVEYDTAPNRKLFITSQSIRETDNSMSQKLKSYMIIIWT